jgi:arsenite-transporting ATPase
MKDMRILMFTGKGGVRKTSLAAATGIKLAALNYRTLVMSIDPAHSLGDSFDLETDLFHLQTSDPLQVGDRLWIKCAGRYGHKSAGCVSVASRYTAQ